MVRDNQDNSLFKCILVAFAKLRRAPVLLFLWVTNGARTEGDADDARLFGGLIRMDDEGPHLFSSSS